MSDFGETSGDDLPRVAPAPTGNALSVRIMLSAIIILFFVVVLMVFLHLYARWYLLRSHRRRRFFLRRNCRTHIFFYVDRGPDATASRGLDSSVLKSLPVFTYSSGGRREQLDCAVCLSEFEESEKARLLPKCGHSFHIDCIDMWFHSHSTCPLCRSPVEPVESPENMSVPVAPDPGPSSGPCSECWRDESVKSSAGPSTLATSPLGGRRKPLELVGVSIAVPRRTEFEDESGYESPASQYRSPMSRMLSFRRILSRDRRGSLSPPAGGGEVDLERGREETHQQG